jgi:hypothetical protein
MSFRSLAAALALATLSGGAPAALLQVVLEGQPFRNSKVAVDGEFRGLPGDVFHLPDGRHALSFWTDNGYRFTIHLRASGTSLSVESAEHRAPNCQEAHAVAWPAPRLVAASHSGVTRLLVAEPVFGASLGRGGCALPSLAACDSRKLVLKARSTPKPAEIWIDGERVTASTDVTLSVPFCTNESTKKLVYRLAGHVNCERQLALAPDAVVEASCELTPLEMPAKKPATKK